VINEESNLQHVSFSRCVHAARLRTCEKQSTTPFIELHRIAFAERKTARAASSFDLVRDRAGRTDDAKPQRDHPEHGRPGTAHREPANAEGAETSREAPDLYDVRRARQCDTCEPFEKWFVEFARRVTRWSGRLRWFAAALCGH
jgi:hypothetical protein